MNEKNLENINEIDMDFSDYDEEDSSFDNTLEPKETNKEGVKTGIILNFNDDDDLDISIHKHPSNKSPEITQDIKSAFDIDTAKNYNEIDMECNSYDDTEEDMFTYPVKPITKKSIFNDDDDLDFKELVLDKDAGIKLKEITVDELEDNFWKKVSRKFEETNKEYVEEDDESVLNENNTDFLKNQLKDLQKKHAKSNKKGAMEMSFHYAGDPEKARELFNKGVGAQGEVFPEANIDTGGSSLIGDSETIGGEAISAEAAAGIGDGGGEGSGMGESLNKNNYNKLLTEVFDMIGFDVVKNNDGILQANDLYNESNIIKAKNISDLIYALQLFVEICIITPLSVSTGENFNSYKNWCDWYNEENKVKYPKIVNEITYCDLLANHLDECEI